MSTGNSSGKHRPRKRFGQHFLTDQSIVEQIVLAAAPSRDDRFLEIGPGLGALTVPLLKRLDRLHAVELDRDIIPALGQLPGAAGKLVVHEADALKFDYADVAGNAMLRIIGNLPYNISTPLLFHLLSFRQCIKDMHFMLQKEVVRRLSAQPNSKEYGRLSVICQFYCAVDSILDVPPGAFNPPPKVDSAVVRLQPYSKAPVEVGNIEVFERVTREAFAQRRKTLRNNLKGTLTEEQIAECNVDPGSRAETLGLGDFAALSRMLSSR